MRGNKLSDCVIKGVPQQEDILSLRSVCIQDNLTLNAAVIVAVGDAIHLSGEKRFLRFKHIGRTAVDENLHGWVFVPADRKRLLILAETDLGSF